MKKTKPENHPEFKAGWRFYAVLSFLLVFLISSAIFSSSSQPLSLKSKAQAACDCPWPAFKKPDGSCEYGFYDTGQVNPYFVDKGHNKQHCENCVLISYSTPNPNGGYGTCRFSNSSVCVRGDGIGGCAGICNFECCAGKKSQDPSFFEKNLEGKNLCQPPSDQGSQKKSCPGVNIQRGPCQNVTSPGTCAFRGESWPDRNWYNQWVYCCDNGDWYAKSQEAQGNPSAGWQSKEECEKEGESYKTSTPSSSNCFEKPTNYGSCVPFSKIGECHQRILPGDPDHLKWFRCGQDGLWKGPCESKEECEGKNLTSSPSQKKEETPPKPPPQPEYTGKTECETQGGTCVETDDPKNSSCPFYLSSTEKVNFSCDNKNKICCKVPVNCRKEKGSCQPKTNCSKASNLEKANEECGKDYVCCISPIQPQTTTLSGTFEIKGEISSVDLYFVNIQIKQNGKDFQDVLKNLPLKNNTWSWEQAEKGKTYQIKAVLLKKDDKNFKKESTPQTVVAPASGIKLVIEITETPKTEEVTPQFYCVGLNKKVKAESCSYIEPLSPNLLCSPEGKIVAENYNCYIFQFCGDRNGEECKYRCWKKVRERNIITNCIDTFDQKTNKMIIVNKSSKKIFINEIIFDIPKPWFWQRERDERATEYGMIKKCETAINPNESLYINLDPLREVTRCGFVGNREVTARIFYSPTKEECESMKHELLETVDGCGTTKPTIDLLAVIKD